MPSDDSRRKDEAAYCAKVRSLAPTGAQEVTLSVCQSQ